MKMPGFTAEAAVYATPETYRQNSWVSSSGMDRP
jgi:hypothetical protein